MEEIKLSLMCLVFAVLCTLLSAYGTIELSGESTGQWVLWGLKSVKGGRFLRSSTFWMMAGFCSAAWGALGYVCSIHPRCLYAVVGTLGVATFFARFYKTCVKPFFDRSPRV